MSFHSDATQVPQPGINIPPSSGVLSELDDKTHQKLLEYLTRRLKQGDENRAIKLNRYSRIDRIISTWQKLNPQDSARESYEELTGRMQGTPINLPLLATHLEDTVAFFAEIYSPSGGDFYTAAKVRDSEAAKALSEKMNRDTKARKYYKELCATLRALIKYNIGGFAVRWEGGNGIAEMAEGGNRLESIDMYNYLYDTSVKDVSKICTEAEFAARVTIKNLMWLVRRGLKGELENVDKFLRLDPNRNPNAMDMLKVKLKKEATFYRNPPTHVNLTIDGQDDRTTASTQGAAVDWAAYGAGLGSDSRSEVQGFEIIEMFCWLNPKDFKLIPKAEVAAKNASDRGGNGYALWRFIIVDSIQVCLAEPVVPTTDKQDAEIPHYLSFLTQDDMKEAQRSIMEMMRGFQKFGSFLLNVFMAGARKNVWGTKAIDPSMFDSTELDRGDVATVLKSKIPGRDVRTGFMNLESKTGVQEAFEMLTQTLELVRVFYPSQAQPQQIAGIDRAVKSQVAAVLQGTQRRLHMSVKLVDTDLMHPVRLACYRNIAKFDPQGLNGLTEEIVSKVLGSGLEQLNTERLLMALQEMIFALFQNPQAMSTFDMPQLMTYWSRMQNSPSDLGDFVVAQPTGVVPTEEVPPVDTGVPPIQTQ